MNTLKFNNFFFLFLSINIVLIPFFLITGPFFSDLSLTMCSIFFLIFLILNKKYNLLLNFFFILFSLFYLIIIFSSILSENIFFSLRSSLPYIRFGLFTLCVCYAAKKDNNLFIKIFVVLTIIYITLIFDGYLQFFTGVNIIGLEKTGIRVSSFFGDELILGSYIARFFPIY